MTVKPLLGEFFCILLLLHVWNAHALSQTIRIGSRPSSLALVQAESVAAALRLATGISTEIIHIASSGEVRGHASQDVPLPLSPPDFVGTIDDAVRSGAVDVGVHSLKDIPPQSRWAAFGHLTIGCHLPRADPSDVLLGGFQSIHDLPEKARVGSASMRRQAQLLQLRSDIECINLRGNVHARIDALKAGEVDALILARAGLDRLGVDIGLDTKKKKCDGKEIIAGTILSSQIMLPGCCQGIVAVVCRSNDKETRTLLQVIDDRDARIAAEAERAVLNAVDGSSPWEGRPPTAAFMSRMLEGGESEGGWKLDALLARPDGSKIVRKSVMYSSKCEPGEAQEMGRELGDQLLKMAGSRFFT
mmetsp:Transcript_62468/g.92841  ORF Transcript_62468/g.92841 Transcript_62468/m.92841 type:complete len:360 (-) Transcript_62468:2044-3123(-)